MAKNKLTAKAVKAIQPGERLFDGGGLWVSSNPSGGLKFTYRYKVKGKSFEAGLGGQTTTLAEARQKRDEYKALIARGVNPLIEKHREKAIQAHRGDLTPDAPFSAFLEKVISMKAPTWTSDKTPNQWRNTLTQHAPDLMNTPLSDIGLETVLSTLEPIWTEIPVTASRVQQRISAVFSYAKARGLYPRDNPAQWKGTLDQLLPALGDFHKEEHHPSMPYQELPDFVAYALKAEAVSVDCLMFLILTALRSNEVRGVEWSELSGDVWTVPDWRMKGKIEHRVPLSAQALTLLEKRESLRPLTSEKYVFPNTKGNPLTDNALNKSIGRYGGGTASIHGFRTTFKTWATDNAFDDLLSEQALAHIDRDKVRAAYQRSDMLERRRELMQSWADFVMPR